MPKILIVEDSKDLSEMYHLFFSQNNFDLTIISTKEQLTRQLVLNKPDIILLDVFLNGEDGREFCKNIKQNKDFKALPIILISDRPEKLEMYKNYFADGIIGKPFNIEMLIGKIKSLLNENQNTFVI